MIAKPAETDFEQSLLTIFDCKKATNWQSLYYQILSANCCQRNMTKPC